MTASPAVEDLHTALAGETETYRELVGLTRRERVALQDKNLTSLAEIVRQKEAVLADLMRGEHTRTQILARLSEEINVPASASLSDIIAVLEGPEAQNLLSLRQELTDLVEQLLSLNHGNHLLLQSELDQVDATFNYLMSSTFTTDGAYTARGDARPQATPGTVLNWRI